MPLPPLPPLEPPPSAPRQAPRGEAPTQYIVPIKPIGELVVTAGPLKGKKWPLSAGELKIGREQGQNDILVRFDAQGEIDTSISRRHASIHVEGDYAYVEDKGSAAGTFVNGRQAASGERIPLRSGDEIEIRSAKASTVFRVELGAPLSPAAPVSHPAPPPPLPEFRHEAPPPLPPPLPQYDARPQQADQPREREPIRRRERRPGLDEDNPFAATNQQGMPQWVWFAIGGAAIVIILILVFVFI
jgi:pSer/pThr/pTyr-binding forkhead associated (FHA) protein